jgi:hypothetical protein
VAQSNVFTFKNSGLDVLLFAEVGTEFNGSGLTVLSMLARLGFDPWAEAARWVDLPKTAAIDCLAHSIARMPLGPEALAAARSTASRLILLLPLQNTRSRPTESGAQGLGAMPNWLPMTLLYCALAIGMGVNMLMTPRSTPATPMTNELAVHQSQ